MKCTGSVTYVDERDTRRGTEVLLDWSSFIERRVMSQDQYRTVAAPLARIAGALEELRTLAWGGEEPDERLSGDAFDQDGHRLSEEVEDCWARAAGRVRRMLSGVRRRRAARTRR